MKKGKKKIIIFLLFITVITIFIWYQNNHIVTDVFVYKSDKLPDHAKECSIVQISDLHNASFGKNNKKLIHDIKSLEPDLVAITGDIVDANHTNINTALHFVRETAKKYPVYYVTGNHEYWLSESQREQLLKGIRDAGAVILQNEKVSIDINSNPISLIGLDDNNLHDATLRSLVNQCDPKELTIVLAHEPQYLDQYCSAGADLVLTGHAHGGQVILPFIGPLIAPDQGFFPKYTAGRHQKKDTTMYISRGLGNSVIPVRLLNYPEIVCMKLQGTQ